jgi:solute carrier family 45, member 1/2/4
MIETALILTWTISWLSDTYVAETWRNSGSIEGVPDLQAYAARQGSLAGLYLSITAFIASCTLPSIAKMVQTLVNRFGPMKLSRRKDKSPINAILWVWIASQVYFAFAMFSTGSVGSQTAAVLMITSLGLSWAVTIWVPYSLVGLVLSRQREQYWRNGNADVYRPPQTGAVVGLHNAAISAPQFLSALVCSAIFTTSKDAAQGDIFVLLIGGCWSFVAAAALLLFSRNMEKI